MKLQNYLADMPPSLKIIVGLGLNVGYRKIDFDEIPTHDLDGVAMQTYIAGLLYLGCMIGCGARWFYLHMKEKKLQKDKLLRQMPISDEV